MPIHRDDDERVARINSSLKLLGGQTHALHQLAAAVREDSRRHIEDTRRSIAKAPSTPRQPLARRTLVANCHQ
jgi:hypothetical protein